ncbi:MAG: pyridoxamine 5'-phosphate oxidase family protein [Rikenellaceae bacterium]
MDSKFLKFIAKHHLMTLATAGEEGLYCAHAFYSYDANRNVFVFSSDENTRHGADMSTSGSVAAAIALETNIVGKIQGLQITAKVVRSESKEDRDLYIAKYPYAVAMDMTLWRLEPDFMKLTDNTLGFGKKLIWKR